MACPAGGSEENLSGLTWPPRWRGWSGRRKSPKVQPDEEARSGMQSESLQQRFAELLEQHVSHLRVRGAKATGRCPFHDDRQPSFSADLEKGVWYCFVCTKGGGIKSFALALGEEWGFTRSESRLALARRARFQAEQQAKAILGRRAEDQNKALCAQHREVFATVVSCADLLALFHRRPDLAAEFPDVVARTEKEYGAALFKQSILEARLEGEWA
jgi:DNA primase